MNYDGLEATYWNAQVARVEALRRRIVERAEAAPGRVVPAAEDLAIGTGRRLDATVMFTDITGFSSRNSSSGAEQEMLLRVLNLYFTEMIRIVEDYHGTVEKNTGDGLMAYFEDEPAGSPGQNATKRAVACALTMDVANELLISPTLRASDVPPLQFRTSIEHGAITIARIGAPQRFNANVAIGNAANFASKMLRALGPGEIGLGAHARSRLPQLWATNVDQARPREYRLGVRANECSVSPLPLFWPLGASRMTDPLRDTQSADTGGTSPIPVPSSFGREPIPVPEESAAPSTAQDQPAPLAPGTASTSDFRASFTEETHQYIREYIRLADQKATFFFAGATALLAFLYRNDVSGRWMKPIMEWNVLDVAAFLAMTSLAGAAIVALTVVIPRLAGSKRGFLFWNAIAEYESGRQYSDELNMLSQATLVQTKAEHCYELARICRAKYRVLRLALVLGAVGLLASLVVFLFTVSARAAA